MKEVYIILIENHTKKLQIRINEKWHDILRIESDTILYKTNNNEKAYDVTDFKDTLNDLNSETIYTYEVKEDDLRIVEL